MVLCVYSVVVNIADSRPSKPHYLLAVDESKSTLKDMVGAVSRQLSTGRTRIISREEALLIRELTVSKPLQLVCKCVKNPSLLPL